MEAVYYKKVGGNEVICRLCPHHCRLANRTSGLCHSRFNDNGTLLALNYGECTSAALDPVEKKPLRRFYPGRAIMSLGSWGCNLSCSFCQNWQISQKRPDYTKITPAQAVEIAIQQKSNGNLGLAYTYNEPTMWYEFICQTAPLIHCAGLYNVMVTNGYLEEAPLQKLLHYIDAWNIDLKSFYNTFYQKYCHGTADPVKRTITLAAAVSHVEVTVLIIPGANDTPAEMNALSAWLAAVRPDIPLHITRYFPQYHMTAPPTSVTLLQTLAAAARRHLRYVYIGNI
jgi:pyruvate formate lyase activating enzyme